jgi:hypothetical protein
MTLVGLDNFNRSRSFDFEESEERVLLEADSAKAFLLRRLACHWRTCLMGKASMVWTKVSGLEPHELCWGREGDIE